MDSKRVLFISQEIHPYLPENSISSTTLALAKKTNESGHQVRVFMPRFGVINERRHQLHEVIRLSGMNVVINDMDMPLIIKVASVPSARMQVYFIDNEEYFKRKFTYTDADGNQFEDNDERAIFFAKGVIETVKKLNWAPDIIHVHGWMASLLPLYLKEYYKDEPLFNDSKIVTSVYEQSFDEQLNTELIDKVKFDEIEEEHLQNLATPNYVNLMKTAIDFSDGLIKGSKDLPDELENYINDLEKPVLNYQYPEEFAEAYTEFYSSQILS